MKDLSQLNNLNSPDAVAKVYSRFVSTFADNAVSAVRVTTTLYSPTWTHGNQYCNKQKITQSNYQI